MLLEKSNNFMLNTAPLTCIIKETWMHLIKFLYTKHNHDLKKAEIIILCNLAAFFPVPNAQIFTWCSQKNNSTRIHCILRAKTSKGNQSSYLRSLPRSIMIKRKKKSNIFDLINVLSLSFILLDMSDQSKTSVYAHSCASIRTKIII